MADDDLLGSPGAALSDVCPEDDVEVMVDAQGSFHIKSPKI